MHDDLTLVWDLATGTTLWDVPFKKWNSSAASYATLSQDGNLLATGHEQPGSIRLWNVNENNLIQEINGIAPIMIGLSADGELLVGSGVKETLVWKLPGGDLLQTLPGITESGSAEFCPRRGLLARMSEKRFMLFDVVTGQLLLDETLSKDSNKRWPLAFSPDGLLLVAMEQGGIVLIDTATFKKTPGPRMFAAAARPNPRRGSG